MAFQVGDIKFSGTVDDLSFYYSEFGWLVRRKGGPSRKQFKNSPSFARARENSAEFTNCSRAVSMIRKLIIKRTNLTDNKLYHRLIKLMSRIVQFDKHSARGARDPLKGIHTHQAKLLLLNFQVTTDLDLYQVLRSAGILKTIKKLRRKKQSFQKYRLPVRLSVKTKPKLQCQSPRYHPPGLNCLARLVDRRAKIPFALP